MLDMAQPKGAAARECINGSDEEEMMIDDVLEELKRAKQLHPKWPLDPFHAAAIHGTVIIVYAPDFSQIVYAPDFFQTAAWTGGGWTNASDSWLEDVTHWMPLPESPK